MDETLKRLAPLTGIGAVVLLVAGMAIAAKGQPGFASPAEEIAAGWGGAPPPLGAYPG